MNRLNIKLETSLSALTIPDNSYVLRLIRLFFVDNGPNTQIDANMRYFFYEHRN